MKPTRLFSSLFALTLCLAVLTSASFAKAKPLAGPIGLAVDAAGNLYVANNGANQILIYSPSYGQQTSKTITSGVNRPTGLAFDPYGNLWAANDVGGSSSVTEYTNGVQDTGNTITHDIVAPQTIAIDGLDNLWVLDSEGPLLIFSPTAVYAPPSHLVQTINPGNLGFAFTVGAGALVYGAFPGSQVFLESASATLLGNPLNGGAFGFGADALAADNQGNIYGANGSTAFILHPNATATTFVTLPFSPVFGIAVDNVRKRVYFSDGGLAGNQIVVYSTAGVLLKTIHN
jgi:sugar lactone lactonase YvrE